MTTSRSGYYSRPFAKTAADDEFLASQQVRKRLAREGANAAAFEVALTTSYKSKADIAPKLGVQRLQASAAAMADARPSASSAGNATLSRPASPAKNSGTDEHPDLSAVAAALRSKVVGAKPSIHPEYKPPQLTEEQRKWYVDNVESYGSHSSVPLFDLPERTKTTTRGKRTTHIQNEPQASPSTKKHNNAA